MSLSGSAVAELVIEKCRDGLEAIYPGVIIVRQQDGSCVLPVYSPKGTPTTELQVELMFEERDELGRVVEQRRRLLRMTGLLLKLTTGEIESRAFPDLLLDKLDQASRRLTGEAQGYRSPENLLVSASIHVNNRKRLPPGDVLSLHMQSGRHAHCGHAEEPTTKADPLRI
jgi:hypothetical protein